MVPQDLQERRKGKEMCSRSLSLRKDTPRISFFLLTNVESPAGPFVEKERIRNR